MLLEIPFTFPIANGDPESVVFSFMVYSGEEMSRIFLRLARIACKIAFPRKTPQEGCFVPRFILVYFLSAFPFDINGLTEKYPFVKINITLSH